MDKVMHVASYRRVLWLAASSCAVLALAAGPAFPQQTAQTVGVEEVVVTAQKRSENLQSVPLTVQAITAKTATARGIDTTMDLQTAVPGLVITDSSQAPTIFIRGVGTQNTTAGEESENSVYIDGVYQNAMPSALFSFNNIERVEVLKGPQGTLFGRNATGGLINVITRTPSFTPSLEAGVSYGSYDAVGGTLYVTGPLTRTLAADLAVSGQNQAQGWGKNLTTGQNVYAGNNFAVRSKLFWTPDKATEVTLAADMSQSNDNFVTPGAVLPGAVGLGGQLHQGGFYDVTSNNQPYDYNLNEGVSARIQHDLSWARLVSLSAYRATKTHVNTDQDRTQFPFVNSFVHSNTNQVTQEVQLESLPSSKISWILGAFYLNSQAILDPLEVSGIAETAVGGYSEQFSKIDTQSYAGYGQVTVPIGARTNLTGGVRYTDDQRTLDAHKITELNLIPSSILSASKSWAQPTWHLAVDHHFNDEVMFYATYGRGFKSGNYSTFAPSTTPISPETIDAYEAGLKTESFDHRLRINASAFYYNYKNIQILQAVLGGTRLLNAAAATVKGIDVDAEAQPIAGLSLDAGLEFLNGRYASFPNAPATVDNPATCVPIPTELPGPRTGGTTSCAINAAGNQMIHSPDFTGSFAATYQWATPLGEMNGTVSYYYSDSYAFEPDNRLRQPAYSLVNAQLGLELSRGRYRVALFGRNLADTHYYTNMISSVGDVYTASAPRTFGISLNVKL